MSEGLTLLAAGIGSPVALPISLPAAVSVVVAGSAMEATKIRPGARISRTSVQVLLRTPTAIRTTPIVSKLSRRLTVREEC